MKNNKGFTLVEILAAITILAIISIITTTTITHFIKKSRHDLNQRQLNNIKMSAKVWVSDNKNKLANIDCISITLKDLQDNGYIDDNVIDFYKESEIDSDKIYIKITHLNTTYSYEISEYKDNKCPIYEEGEEDE